MRKKMKKVIIICIITLSIYLFLDFYTTQIFSLNSFNSYNSDINKDSKTIVKNFLNLMIEDDFDTAYNLLNQKTKSIFKSSSDLKKYFKENCNNINKEENGILIKENNSIISKDSIVYDYTIVSLKYKSPKNEDPWYYESEFVVFDKLILKEITPYNYDIEIDI
jgi:hypothetical protein